MTGRRSRWLRPPVLRNAKDTGERHATWMELFYDLVFVAAVSQIGRMLHHHTGPASVLATAALFVPIWWCWIGTTFYSDRFDTDDLSDRLLVLAQMVAAVTMAIHVHSALDSGGRAFALAYASGRSFLVIQYILAARHVPDARGLARRFAGGFALAAGIWAASALVQPPLRFWLWGLALMVDIGIPLTSGRLHADVPASRTHLPERFGLFTLIVLGESIVGVVSALATGAPSVAAVRTGVMGMLMAFALWWIYFENLDGAAVHSVREEGRTARYHLWLYAHVPLAAGLTATAAGIRLAVTTRAGAAVDSADRWILCGGFALCLLGIGLVNLGEPGAEGQRRSRRKLMWRLAGVAAALLVAVLTTGERPGLVAGALAVIGIAQIITDPPNWRHHEKSLEIGSE